jgi:L-fucose mutarotase
MLKLIDSTLGADVLHALRSMGHGDELVICDTNFPADTVASQTTLGHLLHMENISVPKAVNAVLSLYPLDTFVEDAAMRMEVVGKAKEVLPIMTEVQAEIDAAEGKGKFTLGSIERFAFYERAKKAYCVIRTGERRFYGCFILKKGVIGPEA